MRKALVVLVLVVLVFAAVFIVMKLRPVPPNGNGTGNGDGSLPWIYPKSDSGNTIWGIKNGIGFGIKGNKADYGAPGFGAPGLLYIYWLDEEGKTYFFNYIGLGTLSMKGLEGSEEQKLVYYPDNIDFVEGFKSMKQLYSETSQEYLDYASIEKNAPLGLSQVTTINGDVLSVVFRLTPFKNSNIATYIIVKIDKEKPREIEISAQNMFPETRPANRLHVSSTWGNLARLRNLYLKDEIVNSIELYEGEQAAANCFYPIKIFGLEKLPVAGDGTITVYAANDESGTWAGDMGNAPFYGSQKFYQYWRKYSGTYGDNLSVVVNGRDVFFGGFINPCGGRAVTGGVTYENFDMTEKYFEGQTFWFGYSYERE